QPHRLGGIGHTPLDNHVAADRLRTFRHDYYAEIAPVGHAVFDLAFDRFDAVGYFGDEDDVAAARHTRAEGYPAGVASHRFNHHHAMMRHCGGVDSVDSLGGDLHGGVVSEREIGLAE